MPSSSLRLRSWRLIFCPIVSVILSQWRWDVKTFMIDAQVKFPQRLREARRSAKLTQAELAKRIGVGDTAIGNMEAGRQLPSFETLIRLADELRVTVDWLAGGVERNGELPKWLSDLVPKLTSLDWNGQEAVRALLKGLGASQSSTPDDDHERFVAAVANFKAQLVQMMDLLAVLSKSASAIEIKRPEYAPAPDHGEPLGKESAP